jgi:hypothetical protein
LWSAAVDEHHSASRIEQTPHVERDRRELVSMKLIEQLAADFEYTDRKVT